ncbi:MAG: Gfo/Idh/MocA family oxidoreductase, partial [Bryobacteraceae bacterium]
MACSFLPHSFPCSPPADGAWRAGISLRIAVAGAGAIGREHLLRIQANPRCHVVAVADPSPDAAGLGFAHYRDVETMLARETLDGAIVATPNHLHLPVANALLANGVPTLVEKPVAESMESADRLAAAVAGAGVPVLVGHHRRHSAALQKAREIIGGGALGRLLAVNATTLFHKPAAYFDAAWRRQPGGGPILINLVHDVDTLRFLAGEVIAVQAASSNRRRGFQVEDTAAVLLEFASGALGTILLSDATVAADSWEHTSGENPVYPRDPSRDCLLLAGTRGSLAVPTMRLWTQDGAPSWTEPFVSERCPLPSVDPLARQLDHFCDVIAHRAAPLVSAADGAR